MCSLGDPGTSAAGPVHGQWSRRELGERAAPRAEGQTPAGIPSPRPSAALGAVWEGAVCWVLPPAITAPAAGGNHE